VGYEYIFFFKMTGGIKFAEGLNTHRSKIYSGFRLIGYIGTRNLDPYLHSFALGNFSAVRGVMSTHLVVSLASL
jgi:hypothetical protein